MFTPFKGGKVDVGTFAANVERQVKAGMDFLVPLGTTGETPTLSDDEKRLVLETARAHARSSSGSGQIPFPARSPTFASFPKRTLSSS